MHVCVSMCAFRQEFNSEAFPDLRKEVYLQDIHCVGSLCKLYFRELPNPLLTYELYSKFTVSIVQTTLNMAATSSSNFKMSPFCPLRDCKHKYCRCFRIRCMTESFIIKDYEGSFVFNSKGNWTASVSRDRDATEERLRADSSEKR